MPGKSQTKVWEPQERQRIFMARGEDEAFFGGAAGGGKSDVLVVEALRQAHIPNYKGIIFRKTYRQLGELLEKADRYYPRTIPGARYNSQQNMWRFPSGAKIYFAGMQYLKDRLKWQGWQFDYVAFDELTHFQWEEYSYLMSRNRASGPGTRVYIRATGNPGGVGHGWVKNRFITPAPPMTTMKRWVHWRDPDGEEKGRWNTRIFVPSKVQDNLKLMENDPEYIARLASLPKAEREALLEGNWDSFSGQVFTEFRDDADHYMDMRWTHVVEPFRIPNNWRLQMGFDWGFSKPFACGWYAYDEHGKQYMIRELYGCTGDPDTGVRWTVDRIAEEIRKIESQDENLKGKKIERIGDPAIWGGGGSDEGTIGDMFERNQIYFGKGNHERLSGKMQCHYRLDMDEDGDPMFQVFNTCRHFIRTIPSLVYDEIDVEDVDTAQEDHLYDQWRYCCMERRITPKPKARAAFDGFDPLDQRKEERKLRRYAGM